MSTSPRPVISSHADHTPTRSHTPTPAFSRPPSESSSLSDSRYPPIRLASPATPRRRPPTPVRYSSYETPSPSTLSRAVNTALPSSPPDNSTYSTPPSSFPSRLNDVELRAIPSRHTDSPFDDRHSVSVDQMSPSDDGDPFAYHAGIVSQRQKTMPGYRFASMSPPGLGYKGEILTFEAQLEAPRTVSQARRSLYPLSIPIPTRTIEQHPDLQLSPELPSLRSSAQSTPVKPTFRGLFSLSLPQDYLFRLLPAVILSIACSLIQPYMSLVIGEAFTAFTNYPSNTHTATAADQATLISGVRSTTIKLALAGGLAVVLNYLKGALWIRHGEALVGRLRKRIYEGVQSKGMDWFDMGMGMKQDDEAEEAESIGAGGLMAKFTRFVAFCSGQHPLIRVGKRIM